MDFNIFREDVKSYSSNENIYKNCKTKEEILQVAKDNKEEFVYFAALIANTTNGEDKKKIIKYYKDKGKKLRNFLIGLSVVLSFVILCLLLCFNNNKGDCEDCPKVDTIVDCSQCLPDTVEVVDTVEIEIPCEENNNGNGGKVVVSSLETIISNYLNDTIDFETFEEQFKEEIDDFENTSFYINLLETRRVGKNVFLFFKNKDYIKDKKASISKEKNNQIYFINFK